MKIKIAIILIIFLISLGAAEEPVIKLEVKYDDGNIELKNYRVTNGYPPLGTSENGEYLLRITNKSKTIYSTRFDVKTEVRTDGHEGGETRRLNETTKKLLTPYSSHSKKIEIYRDREKIVEENISPDKIKIKVDTDSGKNDNNTQNKKIDQKGPQDQSSKGVPWFLIGAIALFSTLGAVIYLSLVPENQ